MREYLFSRLRATCIIGLFLMPIAVASASQRGRHWNADRVALPSLIDQNGQAPDEPANMMSFDRNEAANSAWSPISYVRQRAALLDE